MTRNSPLYARSLRGWLRHLAATGRLAVAREGASLDYEVAAIAKKLDGKQAVLFPNPGGYTVPIVSGYVASRAWIAEAMGVPDSELLSCFRDVSEKPTKWKEIPAAEAPVRQVTVEKPDLIKLFPIARHSEHDSAPYITAGVIVARNPKTGAQNVSIQRIQVK